VSRLAAALVLASATLVCLPLSALAADTAGPCPAGMVSSGLGDVMVEGRQAARSGDSAGCAGTIAAGSPDVFINGRPAAVQGSETGCGRTIATGASGVFVNGKPLVIAGSAAGCP
jgi:uncharacterized Zn-binding protein involved in type VI secretion